MIGIRKAVWSIASLLTMSLLLVLAACDGEDPPTTNVKRGDIGTSTPNPTTTPAPSPTPTLRYDLDKVKREFALAKERWEAKGSDNYNLTSSVLCHCPESSKNLKLIVRNGAIRSVIDLSSGRTLRDHEFLSGYTLKTINERFEQIESLLRYRTLHYLETRYSPSLGYPTYLAVDYERNVVDDEFTLERLIYEPLDPSVPVPTPNVDQYPRTAACFRGSAIQDPEENPGLVADCQTLLGLRDTLRGDSKLSWAAHRDMFEWEGVVLGGWPPRVIVLDFRGWEMNGTIPPELGSLTELRVLDLRGNFLGGQIQIPPELGNLANLKVLRLGFTNVSGPIPPELGSLTKLEELFLYNTDVSGTIPPELAGMESLESLFINRSFTGCIAPELPDIWVRETGLERCVSTQEERP